MQGSLLLLALVCLSLAVSVHPDSLFVPEIFTAPFLQSSLDVGIGKILFQVLYLIPPLILIGGCCADASQRAAAWGGRHLAAAIRRLRRRFRRF